MKPTNDTASGRGEAALPKFFYRLSPRAQRSYLKGDAIADFNLTPGPAALSLVDKLLDALDSGALASINRAAQALIDELCHLLGVKPVSVEVRGVRPHNQRGELHGIFYPRARPPKMILWMRTARRHDIVKPKTFVRTLFHEFGHYLDYSLLKLDESFHNSGFFKRESFLVRVLYPSIAERSRTESSR
ncbi:MAG: hypothetical protein ABSD31_14475 [Candidatus Binataceae bacterium]